MKDIWVWLCPVLTGVSWGLFLVGLIPFLVSSLKKLHFRLSGKEGYYEIEWGFSKKLLFLTVFIVLSVWCSRYAIACYSAVKIEEGEIGNLGVWEELANSFVHTLQTFSMDEGYTDYWVNGQKMVEVIFKDNSFLQACFNVHYGLVCVIAPLAGGAIVFELLTKVFPSVRLFFAGMNIFSKKYYFSELNENAIALAGSILSDRKRRFSTIVFTDAYTDDEEESGTELLLTAKAMGAVCVKTDILHIRFRKRMLANTSVFLIDKDENSNIETLTKMLSDGKKYDSKRLSIYVFSSDRKNSYIEDTVSRIIDIEKGNKNTSDVKALDLPDIIPVNTLRNMSNTLLKDVPLFEPVINSKKDSITVTILGSGSIGTEMFLSAYWYGQVLDKKLNINVISNEAEYNKTDQDGHVVERGFRGKIDFYCPEVLKSGMPRSPILLCRGEYGQPDAEFSEPYMNFHYYRTDVMSGDFIRILKEPYEHDTDSCLLDTDYFIVCLGTDEDNFRVAEKLRELVGAYHVQSKPDNKTVIAYSVYCTDFCRKLNEQKKRKYVQGLDGCDVYMHAFGSMDEVYSTQNVFMDGVHAVAILTGKKYEDIVNSHSGQGDVYHRAKEKSQTERAKDIYKYKANIARTLHLKYKMFSAGVYDSISIFNDSANDSKKRDREALKRYITEIVNNGRKDKKLLHRLAWLEHRRWCAFLRTRGFVGVDYEFVKKTYALTTFEKPDKDHKFVALKCHPCLIECTDDGILADLKDNGEIDGATQFRTKHLKSQEDLLDILSIDIRDLKAFFDKSSDDFKLWDYPVAEEVSGDMFD